MELIICLCLFFLMTRSSSFEVAEIAQSGDLNNGALSFPDPHNRVRRETNSSSELDEETVFKDNHTYYTSTIFYPDNMEDYWIELKNDSKHHLLSNSHRKAYWAGLNVDFLFYGHRIHKVAVTTEGYLSTSPYFHDKMYKAQYIAPYMAIFNPSLYEESDVLVDIIGDKFIVEWRDLYVEFEEIQIGPFHFQAIMHSDGRIMFLYKKIPGSFHKIKVGLAESSFFDTKNPNLKTFSILNTVNINSALIRSGTVVSFTPLPTCNLADDCHTCISRNISFVCKWCDNNGRCSDGWDRMKEDWYLSGCFSQAKTKCYESKNSTDTHHSPGIPSSTVKNDRHDHFTESPSKTDLTSSSLRTRVTSSHRSLTDAPTKASQTGDKKTTEQQTTYSFIKGVDKSSPNTVSSQTGAQTTVSPLIRSTTYDQEKSGVSTVSREASSLITGSQEMTQGSLNTTGAIGAQNEELIGIPLTAGDDDENENSSTNGLAILIVLISICVASVCGIFFYAYTHPSSRLAIWILEHRPTKWVVRFRRQESHATETTPVVFPS